MVYTFGGFKVSTYFGLKDKTMLCHEVFSSRRMGRGICQNVASMESAFGFPASAPHMGVGARTNTGIARGVLTYSAPCFWDCKGAIIATFSERRSTTNTTRQLHIVKPALLALNIFPAEILIPVDMEICNPFPHFGGMRHVV